MKKYSFKVKDKLVTADIKEKEITIKCDFYNRDFYFFNTYVLNKYDLIENINRFVVNFLQKVFENDPDKSKYKHIFARGKTISCIISNYIFNEELKNKNISKENYCKIFEINKKLSFPKKIIKSLKNGKRKYKLKWNNNYIKEFSDFIFKSCFSEKERNYIINDFLKFERGFLKHILMFWELENINSFEVYLEKIKSTPKWIKKCKYSISLNSSNIFIPRNRWEYWLLSSLTKNTVSIFNEQNHDDEIDIFYKIYKAGKKSYDIWRKRSGVNGPYNSNLISTYARFLKDSERMYDMYKNIENSEFKKLKGSGRNFIDIAYLNHELEQKEKYKLREEDKKIKLQREDELCNYKDLEMYRLKTVGDLQTAGIECHNCIAGYRNDKDSLFYRRNDVCAQVDILSRKVIQCWDAYNKKTKDSEEFKKYLNKCLYNISKKEEMFV